jgi:TRAP-type C4-dicarboxylate transport system permease small subunit
MKTAAFSAAGRWLRAFDRTLGAVTSSGLVLVLPVSLLLFLQWPLRDVVHGYSREANDLAQLLFALYISVAVTYATRRGAHLAADTFARRYPPRLRGWFGRIASAAIMIPWSLFILYFAWPAMLQSVLQLEAFPDSPDPGYFILRVCVWLLALLVFLQASVDVLLGREPEGH